MNSTQVLPQGYNEILKINLQKDKKTAIIVNIFAVLLMVAAFFIGNSFVSIATLFDMTNGIKSYFIRFALLLLGVVVYLILHELVHGICMKMFGAKKINYGFTGMYAFAGSDCYFGKKAYIIIALAPIVVWGIVLLIMNLIVAENFFWVIYVIQIVNLSGAAGDLYVTYKFSKMPKNILVRDTGIEMTIYA